MFSNLTFEAPRKLKKDFNKQYIEISNIIITRVHCVFCLSGSCVYCCLRLMAECRVFFDKCHAVYGE